MRKLKIVSKNNILKEKQLRGQVVRKSCIACELVALKDGSYPQGFATSPFATIH